MDQVQEQVAWFMSLMQTKVQRRCWIHQCRHRAAQLEKEWPREYQGLAAALEDALAAQKSLPHDKGTPTATGTETGK